MPKVTFKNTEKSVEVPEETPLKDVTKKENWPVAYGCEDGICGSCIIKISSGKDHLSPVTETEKDTLEAMGMNDGTYRLACQCKILGDVTIEL